MPMYEDIRVALEYQEENADATTLIPDDVPIIIPTFNTPTYLKSMIDQLESRGWTNVIICDNNSTYQPMIDLLEELSQTYHVVRWLDNYGPRLYTENKDICSRMPKYFIVTDPDLLLNDNMPGSSIDKMKRIVDMYGVSKAGLAIDIDSPEERERFFNANQVDDWERTYWSKKIDQYPEKDDLYAAPVDTTFALYNRDQFLSEIDHVPEKMTCNTSAIRIAGRFTCRHMGWWDKLPLEDDEYRFYKETITNWSSTESEKKRLGY
jgi:glycosyltransferase involved in cell wall biosynthesis